MAERKRRKFWYYIIFILILYGSLFYFVNRADISGLFTIEAPKCESVNFNDLKTTYNLNLNKEFCLDIDYLPGYVFSDNTDLFDINEASGEILFTAFDGGLHPVVVIVAKDLEYDAKAVLLNVVP